MEIRNNIIFSIMVHVMAISSVAIIGGMVRDTELRVPDHITVSLFEEETVIPSIAIPSTIVKDKVSQISQLQEIRPVLPRNETTSSEPALSKTRFFAGIENNRSEEARNDIPKHASVERHPYVTQGSTQVFIVQDKGTSGENSSAQNTTSHIASKNLIDRDSPSPQYSLIRAAIEKAKIYPYIARKKKIQGTVIAEFIINARGYPEDIKITKSSGYEILDSAALNIISKAAPFPKIDGHIVIPITFSLRDIQPQ